MKSPFLAACCLVLLLPLTTRSQETTSVPRDSQKKTADSDRSADALWAEIETLQKGPATPPTSREEAEKMLQGTVSGLQAKLEEFTQKFPNDPRQWQAKFVLLNMEGMLAQVRGEQPDIGVIKGKLEEITGAENAPEEIREMAQVKLVQIDLHLAGENPDPDTLKAASAAVEDFATKNPGHPALSGLQLKQAELNISADKKKARALLSDLVKSEDPEVSGAASQLQAQLELSEKPMDLEFTSVGGKKVSLKDLRGKVVLLDFWATWCGPCVQEVPNVVSAYNKLHGKGFEIVGISLDEDKDALTSFVEKHKMDWPQYFDGKGWKNEISTRFGIKSIPAMWLLDKKGMLVDTDARSGLEEKVEKLLGE